MVLAIHALFENLSLWIQQRCNDSAISTACDATFVANFPDVHPVSIVENPRQPFVAHFVKCTDGIGLMRVAMPMKFVFRFLVVNENR